MKAEDTVTIDLTGKTAFADAMLVTSGRSNRHVGAVADRVLEGLKKAGVPDARVEGMPHCDWVLIDAGDVIVHVPGKQVLFAGDLLFNGLTPMLLMGSVEGARRSLEWIATRFPSFVASV